MLIIYIEIAGSEIDGTMFAARCYCYA